jgi:heme/copper-type cytochrome/quinol oxidase subunit 2
MTPGWDHWWLPQNYSTHGDAADQLFLATFWITTITLILVQVTLVVFMIRYRRRPDRRKGVFTHGNPRLELAWTIAPAVILAVLVVWNKGVWDKMRFFSDAERSAAAKVLVIGQQFKWNIVYPGPDGELGRYLIYPKPTDRTWPDKKPHGGVPGPAYLPEDKVRRAIADYVERENPLGKDLSDPKGLDDDWQKALAREMVVPVNRPIEVQLSSRDVIHDFFLPNFRVKLDAVPGMRGIVHFTATKTSKQLEQESRRTATVDELIGELEANPKLELNIVITADTPGAVKAPRGEQYLFRDAAGQTIVRDGMSLTADRAGKLKAAGIAQVTVYKPGYFDIVCEELCGQGHYTMQARLVVVEQDEYAKLFEGPKPAASGASVESVAQR